MLEYFGILYFGLYFGTVYLRKSWSLKVCIFFEDYCLVLFRGKRIVIRDRIFFV